MSYYTPENMTSEQKAEDVIQVETIKSLYRADKDAWGACFAAMAALLPKPVVEESKVWVKVTPNSFGEQVKHVPVKNPDRTVYA